MAGGAPRRETRRLPLQLSESPHPFAHGPLTLPPHGPIVPAMPKVTRMAVDRTVFRIGRLFDGTGRPVQRNACVIVENGRIASIEIRRPPKGLAGRLIDAPDATLLPGLIDCHVHLTLSGGPNWIEEANEPLPVTAWKAANFAQHTLEAGFTTVRTLGGREFLEIHLRNAIEGGLLVGPRIIAAGYAICMTGGHGWWMGRQADGAIEVRKAVREQLRAGADAVKLIATGGVMTQGVEPGATQLGLEELRAGVEEATKAGKMTAAHAQGTQGIRNAVEAGADSIEHGVFLDEAVVGRMKERGTFLVATLIAPEGIRRAGTERGVPEWAVRKAEMVCDPHRRSFALAVREGVNVAFGTDAGTPFNHHGQNARELEMMVQAGMSPGQALRAATLGSARLLRLADQIGTIEAGKQADLLLVTGDPSEDPTLLQRRENILAVFKAGRQVAGSLA